MFRMFLWCGLLCAVSILASGCSTTSSSSSQDSTGTKVAKQVVKMGIRRSPVAILKAVK